MRFTFILFPSLPPMTIPDGIKMKAEITNPFSSGLGVIHGFTPVCKRTAFPAAIRAPHGHVPVLTQLFPLFLVGQDEYAVAVFANDSLFHD